MGHELAAGVEIWTLLEPIPEYVERYDAGPSVGPYRRDDHRHHRSEQHQRQSDSLQSIENKRRRGAAVKHQVGEEPSQQEERRHSPRMNEVERHKQQDGLVVVRRPKGLESGHA